MDYFWVIGGGLLQIPIVEKLNKLGIKSIVSDVSSECACSKICDYFIKLDIFDIEGHLNSADELISLDNNVIGVLAAGIDAPVTMSMLGEYLNLPVVSSEISKIVHNKAKFRQKMQEIGVEIPLYKEFKDGELRLFEDYLNAIQLPFIIKNVDSSASRGTKIFHDRNEEEEVAIFREACNVSKSNSCLVESLWMGTEHTVETIFDVEGNFHELFITDRFFDYTSGFPIETGLKNPSSLSAEQCKKCYELAKLVAIGIGINIGAAKFDMIYTSEGPRIIEMTTRLSGGFDCQYLVPATTGKDILLIAILTALGNPFPKTLNKITLPNVGLTASVWPEEGKISAITGIEEAKQIEFIAHVFLRKKIGDNIEYYNNCAQRVCFVIASAPSLSQTESALNEAISVINIKVQK